MVETHLERNPLKNASKAGDYIITDEKPKTAKVHA
jgi:hypothetical protein